MRFVIISTLILISNFCFGQSNNIQELQSEVNRINSEIDLKNDSIQILLGQIKIIKSQNFLSKFDSGDGLSFVAVCKKNDAIRQYANGISDVVTYVNENDSVVLINYSWSYWVVRKGIYAGYLYPGAIYETEQITAFRMALIERTKKTRADNDRKREEERAKQAEKEEEWRVQQKIKRAEKEVVQKIKRAQQKRDRENKVIDVYGEDVGRKLIIGIYWIGMTDDMAVISLGYPKKNNKSVGSWGTHEQWVYSSVNLYFENGILTSYQTSD